MQFLQTHATRIHLLPCGHALRDILEGLTGASTAKYEVVLLESERTLE
jgi:hypothetical protein